MGAIRKVNVIIFAFIYFQKGSMCKDEEDVIYYMEDNNIGEYHAQFYQAICQISEAKLDYSQADRYILEGKLKQAQPDLLMQKICKQFEQRMEARIQSLKEQFSLVIYEQNMKQNPNNKKRKLQEFRMESSASSTSSSNLFNSQNYNMKKNISHKSSNYSSDIYCDDIDDEFMWSKKNNRSNNYNKKNIYRGQHQKKKQLPEKVYIGDGMNIFVDEEYRQQVFPNSTLLVSEFLSLVNEVQDYISNLNMHTNLSNSYLLLTKSLSQDLFFTNPNSLSLSQKQQNNNNGKELSWIGREEKKYKSFEQADSQMNSQFVQFNAIDHFIEDIDSISHFNSKNSNHHNNNNNNNISSDKQYTVNQIEQQQIYSPINNILNNHHHNSNKKNIFQTESVIGTPSPLGLSSKRNKSQKKFQKEQKETPEYTFYKDDSIGHSGNQHQDSPLILNTQSQVTPVSKTKKQYSWQKYHLQEQQEQEQLLIQQDPSLQRVVTTSIEDYDEFDMYSDGQQFLNECKGMRQNNRNKIFNRNNIFAYGDGKTNISVQYNTNDRTKFNKKRCQSIEKLRTASTPFNPLQNMKDYYELVESEQITTQPIQFSQELSQVNNVFSQEAFLSQKEFDDNFLQPPSKGNNCNQYQSNKKQRSEDDEIESMLEQYSISNCKDNTCNNPNRSHNNSTKQTLISEEKENLQLVSNQQRKSKSQTSLPRKPLQQLPIEEFQEDISHNLQILPLCLLEDDDNLNNIIDAHQFEILSNGNFGDEDNGDNKDNAFFIDDFDNMSEIGNYPKQIKHSESEEEAILITNLFSQQQLQQESKRKTNDKNDGRDDSSEEDKFNFIKEKLEQDSNSINNNKKEMIQKKSSKIESATNCSHPQTNCNKNTKKSNQQKKTCHLR